MTILMIAVAVAVLLVVTAFLVLRGKAAPVVAPLVVRQVPKTLGEVLVFVTLERWASRIPSTEGK